MATTLYPETWAKPLWEMDHGAASTEQPETWVLDFNPYRWGEVRPGRYINKVWDPIVGTWVRWTTIYIDFQGFEYPYPANWGGVSGYGVERIIVENL